MQAKATSSVICTSRSSGLNPFWNVARQPASTSSDSMSVRTVAPTVIATAGRRVKFAAATIGNAISVWEARSEPIRIDEITG